MDKDGQSKTKEELKGILEKDDEKGKVQKLITAIYTNGDPMPNDTTIPDAFNALKDILIVSEKG